VLYLLKNKKQFTLYLNRFRGKPAITKFDWPFTPSHNSSPPFSTDVSSVLHIPIKNLSTWSWLDHLVSGLRPITNYALFKLAFATPTPKGLSCNSI